MVFGWLRDLLDTGSSSSKHVNRCTCSHCAGTPRNGGYGAGYYDGRANYYPTPPAPPPPPPQLTGRRRPRYDDGPPAPFRGYSPPPPAPYGAPPPTRNYNPPAPGHYYPPPQQQRAEPPRRNTEPSWPPSCGAPAAAPAAAPDGSNQPPPPYRANGDRESGGRRQRATLSRNPRRSGQNQYPSLNPGTARYNPHGDGDGIPQVFPAIMPKPKTMDLPMRRLSPRDRDYKLYAKKFRDNWLHPGKTAEVVHIYLASSADLRSSVRAQKFHNTLKTKGGGAFLTRFHGTQRSCQMGDGPNSDIEPCGKADCHLCSILKEGFDLKYAKTSGMFGPGIYSTTCSSKADIYAKNNHIRSNRRIILICRLVGDRPQMLSGAEQNRRAPDANFNCVEAVVSTNGGRVQYPETVVYDADMIIPVGFVVYKRS